MQAHLGHAPLESALTQRVRLTLSTRLCAYAGVKLPLASGAMISYIKPVRSSSVQLSVTSDARIISPSNEPLYGWAAGKSQKGEPRPLSFQAGVLGPEATTLVDYACNLPFPSVQGSSVPISASGMLCDAISSDLEEEFLASSLPGGQTAIFDRAGKRRLLKFRWVCVTSESTIGAVWRCYAQHGQHYKASQWRAMEQLYFFDAQSDAFEILGGQEAVIEIETGWTIRSVNEAPRLTQTRCTSNRVKVMRLSANGRVKRELESIELCQAGNVTAFFSDGRQEVIAKSAPKPTKLRRAA